EDTHCNNIGAVHRQGIYPALDKWFAMPAPIKETQSRRPAAELECAEQPLPPLHGLVANLAAERAGIARKQRGQLSAGGKRHALRRSWDELLGGVTPAMWVRKETSGTVGDVVCIRTLLASDGDVALPLLLLVPKGTGGRPVVVAVAQHG